MTQITSWDPRANPEAKAGSPPPETQTEWFNKHEVIDQKYSISFKGEREPACASGVALGTRVNERMISLANPEMKAGPRPSQRTH
jgi:hypothetical protein